MGSLRLLEALSKLDVACDSVAEIALIRSLGRTWLDTAGKLERMDLK
jgi:hypothetical protein